MDYVGIDIGSTASKVVARGKKEIEFVLPTGWSSKETTQTIKTRLLEDGVHILAEGSGDGIRTCRRRFRRLCDHGDHLPCKRRKRNGGG